MQRKKNKSYIEISTIEKRACYISLYKHNTKFFIHTKGLFYFVINDQHKFSAPLLPTTPYGKMGCNSVSNSVLVQLLGISNTFDEGGPNVKLKN